MQCTCCRFLTRLIFVVLRKPYTTFESSLGLPTLGQPQAPSLPKSAQSVPKSTLSSPKLAPSLPKSAPSLPNSASSFPKSAPSLPQSAPRFPQPAAPSQLALRFFWVDAKKFASSDHSCLRIRNTTNFKYRRRKPILRHVWSSPATSPGPFIGPRSLGPGPWSLGPCQ
jgi:hypothetical protein